MLGKKTRHEIPASQMQYQDQDQDRLLMKRLNDNHSQGPVIREISP